MSSKAAEEVVVRNFILEENVNHYTSDHYS